MEGSPVVAPPYVAGPLRLAPFRAVMMRPKYVGAAMTARLYAGPLRAAADRLNAWQQRGRFTTDRAPALYVHEYTALGTTVRGLVGSLDVSRRARDLAHRVVLPHESIHLAQADDLADRMEATALNPAPILLLGRYGASLTALVDAVQRRAPDHQFVDRVGQHHRVWAIRDDRRLATAAAGLASTRALLADGHHRYAAYLRLQARRPGSAADGGLAMLVDQDATPLGLGPIHRILHGAALNDVRAAAAALQIPYAEHSRADALQRLRDGAVVGTDGRRWSSLCLGEQRTPAVEQLHDSILPALPRGPRRVTYRHSLEDAVNAVRRADAVAVVLPAPSLDQVWSVVTRGDLMPEKATSFQPKPTPGVLMRSLRDEDVC